MDRRSRGPADRTSDRPEPCCRHLTRDSDAILCRNAAAAEAAEMGFATAQQWEVAIAVSELVTNVIKYAGKGLITMRELDEPRPGLEVIVEDRGPGIPDLEAALVDGWSEGKMIDPDKLQDRRGLGLGLGAVRRLMDELELANRPDGGLRAVARKFLPDNRKR